MNDCPHRRSAVMMRMHHDPKPCAQCAREDEAEAETIDTLGQEVITLRAITYALGLAGVVLILLAVTGYFGWLS